MSAIEIRVPDMGGFKDVAIIDVLVKAGQKIEVDTPLVTLETDKATMDVPSTTAGVVEKVHVAKGGKISEGDLIVTVSAGETAPQKEAAQKAAVQEPVSKPAPAAAPPKAAVSVPAVAAAAPAKSAPAPAPAKAAAAGKTAEVRVPDMGGFKDVSIIDVLVKAGDTISVDTPLVTLETDKATMDVPSTVAGVVKKVHVAKGGKISEGDVIATVSASGEVAVPTEESAAQAAAPQPSTPAVAEAPAAQARSAASGGETPQAGADRSGLGGRNDLAPINESGFSRAHAGPSVRRLARELGVDLTQVQGSGVKGRIMHDDVKTYVKKLLSRGAVTTPAPNTASRGALPVIATQEFEAFGAIEVKPLSRIQKISGPRLLGSWLNIPHVTQFDEADITALEDVRNKLKQKASQEGIKLTPLAFIMRACARALQEFPQFNSSLDADGKNLILKKYIHIGFAADTPNGLVVPVVRNVDHCDIYEIARKLAELAEKARAGRLSPTDMQGGSFTISSLGGIGGTAFTPIINWPEVAILGGCRSTKKKMFDNGGFVPRMMLPLSLSYDHRVVDGVAAARFTTFLAKVLADPRALTEAVP